MFETSPVFSGELSRRPQVAPGWRLTRATVPRRARLAARTVPVGVPPAPPPPGLGSWPMLRALLAQLYGAGPALTP